MPLGGGLERAVIDPQLRRSSRQRADRQRTLEACRGGSADARLSAAMESIDLSPSYPDRLRLERLALVVCNAMRSFLALLVTNARCGAIDTFAVDLHRSPYRKALGRPSVATSGSAALLTFGVFGAPTIIALAGAAQWSRLERRLPLGRIAMSMPAERSPDAGQLPRCVRAGQAFAAHPGCACAVVL